MRQVQICEVGPRDGLQNAKQMMPTETKKAWISALAAAGLDEIEVGSFVPPKLIPAMADTAEIVKHALTIPGLKVVALAPNVKGFERAREAGAHKITFPVSASHQHSVANVHMTPDQMVEEVRKAAQLRGGKGPEIEGAVSTAFGCTMQGAVPEDDVVRIAVKLAEFCDGVALADTVGYANPAQVKRVFRRVKQEIGDKLEGAHFHDTRGLGLANALAAWEEGVRAFDSSMGGLGGCPFAPGASGNVITEDLVFMFESMGVTTGIDFDKLLAARKIMVSGVPNEPLYGHMALAGLPKGFRAAVTTLPLAGLRVVEFSHMVMGPSCGLVLADLGAEVIKVEPLEGDNTRRLVGAGAGFYPIFNRNKKSLALDLKRPEGREIVLRLADSADVMTENFRPGALDKMGLGYEALHERNPRLVYCTLKGFLSGPYEHRPALDEVVQMMGGLAYMTGLPDRPLRVGSSVNDIMGGMFAAIGILAALRERDKTGKGQLVRSALYENTVFLVAQHMAQLAITGEEPPPMAVKKPAWGVYDIFPTKEGDRLFVGVVTDTQWEVFCREFGARELATDERLRTNGQRVKEREWLLPMLGEILRRYTKAELGAKLEAIGLPYAPITRPRDLFDDPHLNAGGMIETKDPRGTTFKVPGLPLELGGERLGLRNQPPKVSENARELLASMGYAPARIDALFAEGVVAAPQ